AEVAGLKKRLDDRSAFDALSQAATPSKLAHATKGRAHPRRAAKESSSSTSSHSSASAKDATDAADTVAAPVSTAEPEAEADAAAPPPPEPGSEAFRRKIATMGGVSAFGGFNPFAGGAVPSPSRLRGARGGTVVPTPFAGDAGVQPDPAALRSPTRTGSASSVGSLGAASTPVHAEIDLDAAAAAEDDLRAWVAEVVADPAVAKDSGKTFSECLKDGVVLCKLITALRPDSQPVKAKGGKFTFIHKENIGLFIRASEAAGVSQAFTFELDDVAG
ncbi:hypothetical protein HK405_001111, partial [Cladochytrium tenue]